MPQSFDKIQANEVVKDIEGIIQRVCNTHKPVIIQGQNGQPVVMIALEDYNHMVEACKMLRGTHDEARSRNDLIKAALDNIESHPLFSK